MAESALFKSSIGKKILMSLTGLFLITFLIIHASINGMIWFNDHGATFTHWGHFMATNLIIRTLELVLVAGFIIHIIDGLMLYFQNRSARPQKYAYSKAPAGATWYSRSMAILGTLILFFLISHTSHFWIPNRINQFQTGEEIDLFHRMVEIFQSPLVVAIYLAGCFSMFWHLLHGFPSAFQSLGLNHTKYNGVISLAGTIFSIVISIVFAMMPISMYFGWIK